MQTMIMDDAKMVDQEILNAVAGYVQKVRAAGIGVETAVLFGSTVQGTATADSDIDLIIIAPEFDQRREEQVNLLWELRAFTDARIEPTACGSQQWQTDESSPILSIARDTGVVLLLEALIPV